MAKGKPMNKELKIKETKIEEGCLPYFIIDEEYGIACDERQEMLCFKKRANRTIKNDLGVETHIESYWKWDAIAYVHEFSRALELYEFKKDKQLKAERLTNCTDMKELVKIKEEINEKLQKALKINGINKKVIAIGTILDKRFELEREIEELKKAKENCLLEVDKLLKLMREKTKEIISRDTITTPKKRVKKEVYDLGEGEEGN